jgi:Na+/H+ antiporter NhaD/arsenite permease-like protein
VNSHLPWVGGPVDLALAVALAGDAHASSTEQAIGGGLAEVAQHAHHVSLGVTLGFAALLVALIVSLALEEKLHAKKSVIVGLFAMVALFAGAALQLLPVGALVNVFGEELAIPVYIPAIDWGVIAIILGSSLFVDVTSRSGLFTWIAIKLTKASGGDPVKLLRLYGFMTVLFSAVLNNVTAMIIVGSLTVVSLDKLGRREKLLAFLLVEGLLTNIGGLLTLISSVPNIIVGTAAGISFVTFFLVASPYVAVATVVTLLMGERLFDIPALATDDERTRAAELIAGFDENDGIESRGFFWFGTVMTALFILAIATTSIMPVLKDLGMGYVALSFGLIMLVRYKAVADTFYQAIDWDLLGFFAALFVFINVMEHAGVLGLIGQGLEPIIELGDVVGPGAILVAAGGFSSVTDNIPLAAMLSKILLNLGTPPDSPLWWSVVFGANLGGNLTPIGSASTLVAVTIIHKHGLTLSFSGFVRKALPFALVQIALAIGYVLVFVR